MNVIEVQQGSQEWLNLRRSHNTASEAPAALGESKYQTRSALLKQKSTGITEEVGAAKQALFNRGHEAEAGARQLAETLLGSDLYPITATLEIDGLKLLASLDGITMDESTIWEHKLWSEKLAADVEAGTLDAHYTIQMDQQLLVTGAKTCVFMTSDGTGDKCAYLYYHADQAKFDKLIAGWKQFERDLANFIPEVITVAPVAKTVASLSVLFDMRVEGKLVSCNLEEYKPAALAYINAINSTLVTDQNFADADADAKFCRDSAKKLGLSIEQALGQMGDINQAINTVREIAAAFDAKGLALEKLVKAEKENRRYAIVSEAAEQFASYINGLNKRIGKPFMPAIAADFTGATKGLKSLDSMKDKVATELARAKIAASEVADRIQINLHNPALQEYGFLFADLSLICTKAADDFANTVTARVTAHKAQEDEKARKAEAAKPVAAPIVAPAAAPAPVHKAPESQPTMTLGALTERLGFGVSSAFLASLGFEATTLKNVKLYHSEDFPLICKAIIEHLESVCEGVSA